MAELINGKLVSAAIREQIANKGKALNLKPGLAVIIVGDDPASQIYVKNKEKACEEVGFHSVICRLDGGASQEELLSKIAEFAEDDTIHGILVQLPLPRHIDERAVIAAIPADKDVDAFHPVNVGALMLGTQSFQPCTPAGVMALLEHYKIDVCGKHCVIIGRSNIVGKPQAMLMLQRNATVTICHSKTQNLAEITKTADILVSAVGRAKFVSADMIKEGAVVIDVGMNRDENGKLCGDVDFEGVEKKASYITPVPGGVGPMTITMLLQNTLTAAIKKSES